MSPSRSLALLLATCLPAAALFGCGGGSEGRSTPAEALAKVRASDYGRAVNLRASDLPYFEPIPDEEEEDPEDERRRERELKRCLGVSRDFQEPLAEVESQTYGTSSPGVLLRVQSTLSVTADAEEAAQEVRLLRGRRAIACFRRVYVGALEDEESASAEVKRASVSRVAVPAADIGMSFGYRFSATVTVHGDTSELAAYDPVAAPPESLTVPIYVDIVGFVAGPAGVSLTATGSPSPVSKALERNLLRLLHERATEHSP